MDVSGIYTHMWVVSWIRASGTDDISMWEPESSAVIESWTQTQ